MSCARLTVMVPKIRNILKIVPFIIVKVWNGVLEKMDQPDGASLPGNYRGKTGLSGGRFQEL